MGAAGGGGFLIAANNNDTDLVDSRAVPQVDHGRLPRPRHFAVGGRAVGERQRLPDHVDRLEGHDPVQGFRVFFLQGPSRESSMRRRKEGAPGLGPRQLLQLEKEVYDTATGTMQWRRNNIGDLEQREYQRSHFDAYWLSVEERRSASHIMGVVQVAERVVTGARDDGQDRKRHWSDVPFEKAEGRLILQVDDILESRQRHRDDMGTPSKQYQLGQDDDLKQLVVSTFIGRLFEQSREVRMADYIRMTLQEIPLDKNRDKHKESSTTEGERNQIRRIVQSLWLARQVKPGIAGPDGVARQEGHGGTCRVVD